MSQKILHCSSLPCWLSQLNWGSQQDRDIKTSILLVAFLNLLVLVCEIFFKLKFSKFIQDIRSFGKFLLIVTVLTGDPLYCSLMNCATKGRINIQYACQSSSFLGLGKEFISAWIHFAAHDKALSRYDNFWSWIWLPPYLINRLNTNSPFHWYMNSDG